MIGRCVYKLGAVLAKKAGTIPFQVIDGQIWICLVSSQKRKGKFVLPKGTSRSSEKLRETALRETFEEAGLKGKLGPKGIKIKAKSAEKDSPLHTIKFFPLLITATEHKWPEMKSRQRLWVRFDDLPKSQMIKRDLTVLNSRRFINIAKDIADHNPRPLQAL